MISYRLPATLMLFAIMISACAGGEKSTDEQNATDSTAPQKTTTPQSAANDFQLKNVMINREYMYPDGEHARGVKMDAAVISKFKPESIDEFFAMGDTYNVVDTIYTGSNGSVYLILKDDPNETSGWLVIYSQDIKVLDMIEVYDENAEGNFYLSSSIQDNIVTATGENITPEENPVSAFKIVEGPRWQIIKH